MLHSTIHHSSPEISVLLSTHIIYMDVAAKKMGEGFNKAGVKEAEETIDKMVTLGADYYYVDGSSVAYLEGKKEFGKFK